MKNASRNKEIFRVGLLGFGLSGKTFHTPLLKAHGGFEITQVLSSQIDEVAKVLPEAEVVKDIQAILQDPQIDLVINTTPNQFHFNYSKKALKAGKNVVIEKPFVNHVSEGEELISLAAKKNKLLTVFQNRRWDSDFLTVKKLIDTNQLGDITLFESYFDRLRPTSHPERWREQASPGSGILYDLGAHLIDQALCLFGKPEEVIADVAAQRSGAVADDYFHLTFKYGKKRVVLRSSSFTDLSPRFFIQGSKGNFIKYGWDPQENALRQGLSPEDLGFGIEQEKFYGSLTTWETSIKSAIKIPSEKGHYLAFYQNLYECLTSENKILSVNPQDSLEVIRLIEQISKNRD